MRKVLLPLLTIAVALVAVGHAQQPQDSVQGSPRQPAAAFKADVNFVEVNAIVTDARGNFVKDLTRDDFEILEDGKPQSPAVFALVDLPTERPSVLARETQPVEPDVQTNTRGFDGRLYVLVLDDLHTSMQRTPLVRDAARRFIQDQFGANDLAAVVHTSGREDAAQDLTASRTRLLAAIDKFQGQKLPSATEERLAVHLQNEDMAAGSSQDTSSTSKQRPEQVEDPSDTERGFNARRALDLVKAVAGAMTDIRGRRKALLLFSEGIDYDIYDVFNSRSASTLVATAQDAIAAAQRANVSIYSIDPRGLASDGPDAGIASLPRDPQIAQMVIGGFGRDLFMSQESLISLARETGGLAIVRTNDIAGGLSRVARENSTYYQLGYNTDLTRSPGKFRKIEVRVKRPGLRVRARRGFVPADARGTAKTRALEAKVGTSQALRAALLNPLPVADVPMRVFAAPFKGTANKGAANNASVLLAIEIDGDKLRFDQRADRFNETLEVSIVAVDYQGKVRGSDRQTLDLKLKPETHEAMARGGIRVLSRLELPPSRYQLRVGIHESTGGSIGTLIYDLDAPDFSKAPFALSGLALTSSAATRLMTTRPDPQLKDLLPAPPSASRIFGPQETVAFVAELYDNSSRTEHAVDVTATVRSAADGRVVFTNRDQRTVEAGDRPRTHGFTGLVPLRDLAPGGYVLRFEAVSRTNNRSAVREVPFTIAGDAR